MKQEDLISEAEKIGVQWKFIPPGAPNMGGILGAQSYVLVQVRKDQNNSNVDALIHKVVPPKKFEEIADTARKQFKNFKQFTIKNKPNDKELDSIVFAIKTDEQNVGRRQDGGRHNRGWQDGEQQNGNEILTYLFRKFLSFYESPGQRNLPHYKAQLQKYNIKPKVITFRNSNGKPSMMYEIDTNSVLKSIKDTISSKKFRKYTEKLVNNAAIVYRTMREELHKN
ncbi:unnamed protein product, partial [Brenthis ino]